MTLRLMAALKVTLRSARTEARAPSPILRLRQYSSTSSGVMNRMSVRPSLAPARWCLIVERYFFRVPSARSGRSTTRAAYAATEKSGSSYSRPNSGSARAAPIASPDRTRRTLRLNRPFQLGDPDAVLFSL
jgi:hypothetical protein